MNSPLKPKYRKRFFWGRRRKSGIGEIPLEDMVKYIQPMGAAWDRGQTSYREENERLIPKLDTIWSEHLWDEENDDDFKRQVVEKIQMFCVGKEEAEKEVYIDRLIKRHGDPDRVLLAVVTDTRSSEHKVQLLTNTLIDRGANPSAQGENNQTPLHFAVQSNFKSVAAKLLEKDAQTHLRDNDNVLPLKIAIENKSDDITALLLKHMPNSLVRSLFTCKEDTPCEFSFHSLLRSDMQKTILAVLDCMIESASNCDRHRVYYDMLDADENGFPPNHSKFDQGHKSAFQRIAKNADKTIVNHKTVRLLIKRKWTKYALARFQFNAFVFLMTVVSLTFCAIVSVMAKEPTHYEGALHIARAVFELFSIFMAFLTFTTELRQLIKHKLEYFHDPFNWIDSTSAILLLTVIPLRFMHYQAQWHVFAFGYLLWFLRIFEYAAVFRTLGAHAQILYRILMVDFVQFGTVFLVILVAFSGTFLLSLRGDNNLNVHEETSSFWRILFVGIRILIETEKIVDYTGPEGYDTVSTLCMVLFLFTCTVILVNILIAQLSDTYQNVQHDAQRGLEVNRACIIYKVELNSLVFRKSYRTLHYVEFEEIPDLSRALIKSDTPPLSEMNMVIQDIWESLDNHKMNVQLVSNRVARQENTLRDMQDQLKLLVGLQTGAIDKDKLRTSGKTSCPHFNIDTPGCLEDRDDIRFMDDNRVARQENTLRDMQDQLNLLVGLQTGAIDKDKLRTSGKTGRSQFNLDTPDSLNRASSNWRRVRNNLKERGYLEDIDDIRFIDDIPEENGSQHCESVLRKSLS